MTPEKYDAQAIIDYVTENGRVDVVSDTHNDDLRLLSVPQEGGRELVSVDGFYPTPNRPRGTTAYLSAASFVSGVLAAQAPATTCVYVDDNPDRPAIVAIMNDHASINAPGWRDYRATLELRETPEWRVWKGIMGRDLSQSELVEFLEDHRMEVVDPSHADLYQIVTNFSSVMNSEFRSATNTANGTISITFVETETKNGGAGSGTGTVEMPKEISIGIAVFQGMQRFRVKVSVSYRVRSGNLTFKLRIPDFADTVRSAVAHVVADVLAGMIDDAGALKVAGLFDGIAPGAVTPKSL